MTLLFDNNVGVNHFLHPDGVSVLPPLWLVQCTNETRCVCALGISRCVSRAAKPTIPASRAPQRRRSHGVRIRRHCGAPGRSARNCSTPMSSLNISLVEEEKEKEKEASEATALNLSSMAQQHPPPLLPSSSLLGDNGCAGDDRWVLRCETDFMAEPSTEFRAEKDHAILCSYFSIRLRVIIARINYSASKQFTSSRIK